MPDHRCDVTFACTSESAPESYDVVVGGTRVGDVRVSGGAYSVHAFAPDRLAVRVGVTEGLHRLDDAERDEVFARALAAILAWRRSPVRFDEVPRG